MSNDKYPMNVIFNSILDLIFPPRCEVCRDSSPEALCASCFQQIKFMKPHLGIHSASVYEGTLRTALHRLKFDRRRKLAEPLGILMVQYLSQSPSFDLKAVDAVIPVPLHAARLRRRGFNQAELLGEVVGRYFGWPLLPALDRERDTHAQFDLPRAERLQNVRDAFSVNDPAAVEGKRLVLLDDIYTTGATIGECVRQLRAAGAKRVEVVTLSRAVED